MRVPTRRIVFMLLPCVAMLLLLALAWPEPALAQQQTFSIDFPKIAGAPNSCMTNEAAGNGGTYLRCRIVLPDGVPSNLSIRAVFFDCRPGSSQACLNTRECPGNGAICDRHPNPVIPVDFNISNPGVRAVEWWGWTSDKSDATLHFDVSVGP
jgi:hypothetical protein